MTTAITTEAVLEALSQIPAPGVPGRSVVAEGYVKDIRLGEGGPAFTLEVPGPLTPARARLAEACQAALRGALGVEGAQVETRTRIPASFVGEGQGSLAPGVKNFIAVGSGKGGVGKSTVSANLACGLARAGAKVGILDVDVYGPSVPLLFDVPRQAWLEEMQLLHDAGRLPPEDQPQLMPYPKHGVKTMSLGYLVEEDKAAIWRGPMVHGAIQQLLRDVAWGELDYLVLDLPPGTGDAQLTVSQSIPLAGAVVVCTPQPVALADARKARNMFATTKTEVLGLLENMSGDVFGRGGAEDAATEWGVPFLGSLPLDPAVRQSGDRGVPLLAQEDASGPLVDALWEMVDRVTAILAAKAKARPRSLPVRRS